VFGTDYDTPDGTCVRDYIQVNDLARAHLVALQHLRDGGDCTVMNCGYGHGASVLEVVDVVKKVSGVNFEARLGPRRPGDPAQLVARVDRIRSLGWEPRHDNLEEIVDQALRWERSLAGRKAA
jgi:UDP-glucose 4-epimerase